MSESSEGFSPKEQNKRAISDAWVRLQESIDRNRGEVLLDGSDNLYLRYATSKPLFGIISREIETYIYEQISFNEGDDYARGSYYFEKLPESPNIVIVRFGLDTDPHRESQGYGSGLIGIVNDVVIDATQRFRAEFDAKTVMGVMVDKAEGQGGNRRDSWTSFNAEKLGYSYNEKYNYWFKNYQGDAEVDFEKVALVAHGGPSGKNAGGK